MFISNQRPCHLNCILPILYNVPPKIKLLGFYKYLYIIYVSQSTFDDVFDSDFKF